MLNAIFECLVHSSTKAGRSPDLAATIRTSSVAAARSFMLSSSCGLAYIIYRLLPIYCSQIQRRSMLEFRQWFANVIHAQMPLFAVTSWGLDHAKDACVW